MSEIKDCPFCGKKPRQHQVDKSLISHDNGQGCILAWIGWTHIDEWNKLCDLVEKGRKYDEMHIRLTRLCNIAHTDAATYESQRNEAVRLLRHWVSVLKSAHSLGYSGCNADSTNTFLASIDKKVGGE